MKELIQKKREERESLGMEDSEEMIIDEEEFDYIRQLKEAKKSYREAFDHMKEVRKESDYVNNNLLPAARERLVSEFENWFVISNSHSFLIFFLLS